MSIDKFSKQRAINLSVDGFYTPGNWYDARGKLRTFPCRTTRVSPFRMMLEVPMVGKIGDDLTSYFGDFGKLEGRISDTGPGRFLFELDMTPEMRTQLADKLTWLEKKQKEPSIADLRKDSRFIPESTHSTVTMADGTIHACCIVDMSASGVALTAQVQPPIGIPLAVGACVGRVIRHLPNGFAVKFVDPQSRNYLDRLIRKSPPLLATSGGAAVSDVDSAQAQKIVA